MKSKYILWLFLSLLIISKRTISQQYLYEEIAKAFQYGNFKKCFKLAEKENKLDPEKTLPYIYLAISLYQGQGEKSLLKDHPNPLADSYAYLKKGKYYATKQDRIPSTFVISLKAIQKEIIRPIKNNVKSGNLKAAKEKLIEFNDLFDNSTLVYFNYSTPSIINYCNDLLSGSQDEIKSGLINFSVEIAQNAIDRLLTGENNNIANRELQNIQSELLELISSCIEIKKEDLAKPIAKLLLDKFDNRSEKYRNFYAWKLINLGLINRNEYLQSNLYKNQQVDPTQLMDSAYVFEVWHDSIYQIANTGKYASYLSKQEKNILYIINLSRINPDLFESTFLAKYIELNPDEKGSYASSLKKTLKKMDPLPPYQPDSLLFLASQLHAKDYGGKGKEGHGGLFGSPEGRMEHFGAIGEITAENCDYGMYLASEIVLHLLVDNGISGVGHRKNLLASDLLRIGISVQPHAQYDINCVMDFMD